MTEIICIDQSYSTTRLLTREQPDIESKPLDKFESILFLPENEERQGQGGLRTQGYFKTRQSNEPLITIVTVVFNGEQFLEETIQSVINQTYGNVEYIIIDGGSTDGTLEIIRKYEHVIDYWVSEKDKGISDAFNKAVVCAFGEYLNFQGDGDGFFEIDSLKKVLDGVDIEHSVLISAKIQRVDLDGTHLYISKQENKFHKATLLHRMSIPHQGLLTHMNFFKKYGLFDTNNIFCMDYEHLLRAYHEFPEVAQVDLILSKWRADGLGNGKINLILAEYNEIKKYHKVAPILYLDAIYYWSVLKNKIKMVMRLD
jgi:glycosyltransferase involved in cell wall biosynthesis